MTIESKLINKFREISYPAKHFKTPENIVNKYRLTLSDNFDVTEILGKVLPRISKDGIVILSTKRGLKIENLFCFEEVFGRTIQQGKRNIVTEGVNHFEVSVQRNNKTAGLSNRDQAMHVDGIYYTQSYPKIVMLYCLYPATIGGYSLLVDGLQVYNYLSKHYRQGLEALCLPDAISIELIFQDKKIISIPVFQQMKNGNYSFTYTPYANKINGTESAERAYKMISGFIHSPRNQLKFKLKQGETLVLDNTRFVHARTGFPREEKRIISRIWFDGMSNHNLNLGF